jgi:hypothetical protein
MVERAADRIGQRAFLWPICNIAMQYTIALQYIAMLLL